MVRVLKASGKSEFLFVAAKSNLQPYNCGVFSLYDVFTGAYWDPVPHVL